MLRIFCTALPLVARVALAAPALAERCQDPEQHAVPLSSPVSSGPADSLPFGSEPAWGASASQPSHPDLWAPKTFDLGSDTQPPTSPISVSWQGNPTPAPSSSSSWSAGNDSSQSEARPPFSKSSNAGASRPHGKKKNVVYFTDWSIYGAGYLPQNLPADEITHLLYAFAGIGSDGSVISIDTWGDEQKRFGDNQTWDESANNVHGAVEQVFLLKKQHRQMKTLLSIGGWTASQQGKFDPALSSEAGRRQFARTAVELLARWGFDGLDIDYEYPLSQQESQNFVSLLRECREALDNYAGRNGQDYHYLLTVATPAGPQHYGILDMPAMDQYVDSWHLMAYDYAGSWDDTSGNQANVFADGHNPTSTKFNSNDAVDDYLANGIDPNKIIFGLPLYGRSFMNTKGLGQPYQGLGQGSIEQGVWLYRDLPRPNADVYINSRIIAAYCYDEATKELVSYDTVDTARWKAQYLLSRNLGGAVFWEASGDKTGENSLILTVARELGDLDDSWNMIDYPESSFANIKGAA
ncbi:glycoside hydrolase family 18 protein [Trichoderma sp. SZMC 28014]